MGSCQTSHQKAAFYTFALFSLGWGQIMFLVFVHLTARLGPLNVMSVCEIVWDNKSFVKCASFVVVLSNLRLWHVVKSLQLDPRKRVTYMVLCLPKEVNAYCNCWIEPDYTLGITSYIEPGGADSNKQRSWSAKNIKWWGSTGGKHRIQSVCWRDLWILRALLHPPWRRGGQMCSRPSVCGSF